jgi:hypothetical protein
MSSDSKLSKFLLRYIFLTDIGSLSKKERISIILIPSFLILVETLYLFFKYSNVYILVFLFGFYVFFVGLAHPLFYFEKYKEKYGFYSKIRFGGTYQMMSKNFSFIIPGLIIMILSIGLILNKLVLASFIAFAFILPFLALFFRIDVFNDNSSIGGDEFILGYHPMYYGLLSLLLGFFGYYNVYKTLNSNLELSVLFFIMTVIFQILFLFPDKCNEVLFFDLRRKKGFIIFVVSLIVVYILIFSLLNGTFLIDLSTINLSVESVIRLVFIWGIGIILAILFIRQIKQMYNKK